MKAKTLSLTISNDEGLTESQNAQIVSLAAKLPRLQSLVSPRLLFSDTLTTL